MKTHSISQNFQQNQELLALYQEFQDVLHFHLFHSTDHYHQCLLQHFLVFFFLFLNFFFINFRNFWIFNWLFGIFSPVFRIMFCCLIFKRLWQFINIFVENFLLYLCLCQYSDLLADLLTLYQKRYCVLYINVKFLKGREDLLALSLDEYLSYKYGFYILVFF